MKQTKSLAHVLAMTSFFLSIICLVLTMFLTLGGIIFYAQLKNTGITDNKAGETASAVSTLPKQPKIKLPEVIYNISGKITRLEKDGIVFNAEIIYLDEEGRVAKTIESRKITTDSSTKIAKLSIVNSVPMEEKKDLKDLKVGDRIEAVSNKDIGQEWLFYATKIRILP